MLLLLTNGAPEFWQAPELPESLKNSPFYGQPNDSIQLVIIGIGQPSATTLNASQDASNLWHVNGQVVTSRLEENRLQTLAARYGGHYLRAEPIKHLCNSCSKPSPNLRANVHPKQIAPHGKITPTL